MTRRRFVHNLTAAVGTVAAAPIGFAKAHNPGKAKQSLKPLSYAAFAGQIGTSFLVTGPSDQTVELRLKKVLLASQHPSSLGRRPPADANNEKFSLIFIGPDTSPLPDAIHSFEHSELGRFQMYFGEIGLRKADCIRYEAVVNQPAAMTYPG